MFAELKREIAIWKRTARHMRVVSLEERAVRGMLLQKAEEVQRQLREQINHKYVVLLMCMNSNFTNNTCFIVEF